MRKGQKHNIQTRLKMRTAKLGKPSNNKGKRVTPENRGRLQVIRLGTSQSPESREKNRQSQYIRHRSKNPDYIPDRWLDLRKKRIRVQGGQHSEGEWQNLKAQYNWTCPCCGNSEPGVKLTRDHIIPISKGGTDNIENIQPLCKPCNSRKHTMTIRY